MIIKMKGGKMKNKKTKKNKYLLGMAAFAMIAVLGITLVFAFPFGKESPNSNLSDEERTLMQQEMQSMQTALENNDYDSWKILMEKQIERMQASITEDNFNKLVEQNGQMSQLKEAMDKARETGDFSEVEALREEFGIDMKDFGRGPHRFGGFEEPPAQ
jgi:hypothetical protein